jgi:hypothetical protein
MRAGRAGQGTSLWMNRIRPSYDGVSGSGTRGWWEDGENGRKGCVPFQEKVSLVRSLTVVSPWRWAVSVGEGRGEDRK